MFVLGSLVMGVSVLDSSVGLAIDVHFVVCVCVCVCVYSIFMCQTVVWLPVFGIFNVCTDVDACNCS